MSRNPSPSVLSDVIVPVDGALLWAKRIALVAFGIIALALAAKVKFPVPPSPVPVTFGTFIVLGIGAAYGPRLGFATIFGYMLVGAAGFDVFADSSAEKNGIAYMLGGSGGYLLGYVLATLALGTLALRGWDRSVLWMALAMLIGNVLIYVPGLLWLSTFADSWTQTFAWGLTPFLVGDAMKFALAVLLFPAFWNIVGTARG
ncbi:MAG: biotin transporter BioY [Rhodobacteraceae bacterium]|nr:biotin transporter BioY [Paracoccaceae bacterium]